MTSTGTHSRRRQTKDSQMKIRVTDSMRATYDELAARRGEAVAVIVREALIDYAERHKAAASASGRSRVP